LLRCILSLLALSDRFAAWLETVAFGSKADMRRCPASIASVAFDPSLHLAADFAVMHNAAFPTAM